MACCGCSSDDPTGIFKHSISSYPELQNSAVMTLPKEKTPGEKARERLPGVTIHGLQDAKRLMKAAEWHGKQNVKVASTHTLLPALFSCWLSVATPNGSALSDRGRTLSRSLLVCTGCGSASTAGDGPGACCLTILMLMACLCNALQILGVGQELCI